MRHNKWACLLGYLTARLVNQHSLHSFISHWKLREAYSLASLFSDEPLETVRCDKNTR